MAANRTGPEEHGAPLDPARSGLPTARALRTEFVVLTRSDELLEQIGQALDGAGEVRHVENEEEARRFADPRHAAVMLLDASEHADPGLVVERMHASDGTTVIVVFAPASVATDVAKAIKGSAAFAVLPVPIEMEKTRAVLHGAGEEALARRSLVTPPVEPAPVRPLPEARPRVQETMPEAPVVVLRPVAPPLEVRERPEPEIPPAEGRGTLRASRVPRVAGAALVSLVVVATVAWLYTRDDPNAPAGMASVAGAPPVAREPAQPRESAGVVEGRPGTGVSTEPKEELLDRARAAFHERRYTEPEGDNALHYYRSALAQDPQDAEAREGLDRIGGVLDARLAAALAENRLDDASRTLGQLQMIRPNDPELGATGARLAEQRIGAALARGDAGLASELLRDGERAGVAPQRLALLRDQLARLDASQRAERLSRLVSARIRDGQLLAPTGDSAKYHLGQLLRLPEGRRLGAAASDELARAFAERASRAAQRGQGAEAEQWLAEATALGYVPQRPVGPPSPPVAAALAAQSQPTARQAADSPAPSRADAPAAPATRASSSGSAVRPQSIAAPRGTPVPEETSLGADDFKRTRYVAPTYPTQALARGQSGEVRVRLTLDTSGRVADVQVLSAAPAGVFEQAAVNAVRKWRFEPVMRDGRAIEASVATTISFRPDSAARR